MRSVDRLLRIHLGSELKCFGKVTKSAFVFLQLEIGLSQMQKRFRLTCAESHFLDRKSVLFELADRLLEFSQSRIGFANSIECIGMNLLDT